MPHHHHDQQPTSEHPPTTAEHWDERYSGEPVWSGNPNGALVDEVAALAPGRALDVGCGEGADSVWLAQQGWEVTSLDISSRAIEHTLAAAEHAGIAVRGIASAFMDADLEPGSFDLVSAMYPVLSKTPEREAEHKLMELVAPGGTLLFVHHEVDPEHAAQHGGFNPAEFLTPPDVREALGEGWEIVSEDRRARHVEGGAGAGHTTDLVVRARRLSR